MLGTPACRTRPVSSSRHRLSSVRQAHRIILGARLFESMRTRDGLSNSVASFLSPQVSDGGSVFGIYASFSPSRITEFEREMNQSLATVSKEGFSDSEVKNAIDEIARERRESLNNNLVVSATLASNAVFAHTMEDVAGIDRRLVATSTSDVNRAIRLLLDSGQMVRICAGSFSPNVSAGESEK